MSPDATAKLLDDYQLGEARREAEAERIDAERATIALLKRLVDGERLDDLAKLAPLAAALLRRTP
jgi:hypothetical protein